ncbi:hypothetical protein KUTeg_014379 [Tegillarca granosa]|uniref:Seryl-tRNA synthetase n=1 Tax=Tegillarca granosa TaxID=220873 RepID=A0ABQ9F058_TEGGR|nr:hypothetical protein KUTeg_014379 [Tegillarca granosa]
MCNQLTVKMMRNVLLMRHMIQKSYLGLHHVESSYQVCRYLLNKRHFSQNLDPPEWHRNIQLPDPELNFYYLVNNDNTKEIEKNIENRKGVSDIHKVIALWKKYHAETDKEKRDGLWKELLDEALKVPNSSNPNSPIGDESQARVVEIIGNDRVVANKLKTANVIGEELGVLSHNDIVSGDRTLHFYGGLAKLEQALIKYTLSKIIPKGFTLLTVPDMLHPAVIEKCGFPTTGVRNQVFKLNSSNHGDICFAGTAEMPLAGYFMNEVFSLDELPTRVCAVSRCYRAEVSEKKKEKGLYRTRIFTKISSASDCTDYQSRRLNIKYRNRQGDLKHVCTVNGTACAVPRIVMAVFEKFRPQVGSQVFIPPVLLPYMDLPEGETSLLPMDKHFTLHKQSRL